MTSDLFLICLGEHNPVDVFLQDIATGIPVMRKMYVLFLRKKSPMRSAPGLDGERRNRAANYSAVI
ncbi:MAG: hypothetical protein D3906_16720 [Candidatus Electrothrix sp. AUS1_2]|nr:hypothetical protein [Candidatus Electrothrix sp. AUS1_2]